MSINLLPWRKKLARKKRIRLGFIVGILLALSWVMTLHFYVQEIKNQKTGIILLASLTKEVKKISISPTQNTLQAYQALKNKILKIKGIRNASIALSEKLLMIIEKTPPGISLTRLSISEKQTIIDGFSAHNRPLGAYIKKLSDLFGNEKFSMKMNESPDKIRFEILMPTRGIV